MFDTKMLRRDLIADLSALRAGQISNGTARARAYVAKQIIDTVKVEAMAMNVVAGFDAVPLLEDEAA